MTLQRPNIMMERRIDAEVQVDIIVKEDKTDSTQREKSVEKSCKESIAIERPSSVASNKSTKSKNDDKMMEVAEKRRIPWFAGCEYQCRYENCGEMYFYNQDLRAHVKKLHGDPDEYLDKFKVFETKDEYIHCKECSAEIKRHFSSVFTHLRDKHNEMTLEDYAKKYKMKDYEKSYKVLKKKQEDPPPPPSPALIDRKRKSRSESPVLPPVKKAKPEQQEVTPSTSKASTSASTSASTPASTSDDFVKPWYSGCEYACQICGEIYFSLNELLYHTKTVHRITGKPYQKKYGKFETKRYFYNCKLCFNKVKHSKASIQSHLTSNHEGMKLTSYEEVFHPSPDQKAAQNIQDQTSQNPPNVAQNVPKGVQKATKPSNPSAIKPKDPNEKFKNWSKGTCTFRCSICSYTTGGSVDFWKHIKVSHKFEINAYKEQHGNPCIVMNKINCLGCTAVLRYDYGTLLGHATTKHNMPLMEFYIKFFKATVEKEPTPIEQVNEKVAEEAAPTVDMVPKLKNTGSDLKKRAHMWGWKCRYSNLI